VVVAEATRRLGHVGSSRNAGCAASGHASVCAWNPRSTLGRAMHTRTAIIACAACALAGAIVGVTIDRAGQDRGREPGPPVERERPEGARAPSVSSGEQPRDPAPHSLDRTTRSRAVSEDSRRRSSERVAGRDERSGSPSDAGEQASDGSEDPGAERSDGELDRLRAELADLRDEQREVMGEPIEAPADLEPRFGGASMSGAIQNALVQANVPGAVESTDCSEHPCIVFGRLEGDEEDMEEVERAAALSVYDGDVLTLLFWATSVEEPGATPTETGLFALAFYSFEDRAARGEELDRRIRARTMEFWNHDRPGRETAGGH